MKCPFCGSLDNRVVDSRLSKDNTAIRRRRECLHCGRRFTTYEYVEEIQLMVIKKMGVESHLIDKRYWKESKKPVKKDLLVLNRWKNLFQN